jgi:hypothetical protein
MNLKQKISIAHSKLPLPSEVAENEIVCTVRQTNILENNQVQETETQLIFKKDYAGSLAIGWTLAEKVNVF